MKFVCHMCGAPVGIGGKGYGHDCPATPNAKSQMSGRAQASIETLLEHLENVHGVCPACRQHQAIEKLGAALRVAWEDGRRFMEHDDAKQFDHEVLAALRGEKG